METFARIHLNSIQEDARQFIQDYSSSALGFGGDKKTVKKHLDPYIKILNAESESKETKPKGKGFGELSKAFGNGF